MQLLRKNFWESSGRFDPVESLPFGYAARITGGGANDNNSTKFLSDFTGFRPLNYSYTLSFWIRYEATSSSTVFSGQFILGEIGNLEVALKYDVVTNKARLPVTAFGSDALGPAADLYGDLAIYNILNPDQWYHIVITYSHISGNIHYYVDGVEKYSIAKTLGFTPYNHTSGYFAIGQSRILTGRNVYLDDVLVKYVYSTAADVLLFYNSRNELALNAAVVNGSDFFYKFKRQIVYTYSGTGRVLTAYDPLNNAPLNNCFINMGTLR